MPGFVEAHGHPLIEAVTLPTADAVVETAPESIADLEVQATFLAGRQVYPKTG